MADDPNVGWPAKSVHETETDLQSPLVKLLEATKLTGTVEEPKGVQGVIEAASLTITNQVKRLIIGAGGLSAVLGTASGWAALKDNPNLAITIAAGVAFVLGAAVLGLAMVMNGDVRGRAAVTTEQLRGRADVVTAFLGTAARTAIEANSDGGSSNPTKAHLEEDLRMALSAYGDRVEVTTERGASRVEGLEWSKARGARIRLSNGDLIDIAEAMSFSVPMLPASGSTRNGGKRGSPSIHK